MVAKSLRGKVVVVTGGTRGIGLEAGRLFSSCGASLVIVSRDAAALDRVRSEFGAEVLACRADVSRPEELKEVMRQTGERFGRIDVLFANAGITESPPILETAEPDFDRIMGVNVKGVFFAFTCALPLMPRGASAIFTCSVAHELGRPGEPLYAASKAAVAASPGRSRPTPRFWRVGSGSTSSAPAASELRSRRRPSAIRKWMHGSGPRSRWPAGAPPAKSLGRSFFSPPTSLRT